MSIVRSLPVLAGVIVVGLAAAGTVAAQEGPQTFHACYVPQVGAMYLINLEGLPDGCLSENHEEISWTEGGDEIPDGSVTTQKLADGAVTAEKLGDDVSGAFPRVGLSDTGSSTYDLNPNSFVTIGAGTTVVAPAAGFVLVVGAASFFFSELDPCIEGSCRGELVVHHNEESAWSEIANQSVIAPSSDDWVSGSATVTWVFPVQPGENTFQLRVRGTNQVIAHNGMLTAVFLPFGPDGGPSL